MRAEDQPFVLVDWWIDPSTGEMRRGTETARLEPRVMEVLVCLARAEGRVVSKKELFDSVWGGLTVTDDVLRRCIYSLRQTLGDDPDQPRYIRTLPRRGYKLVAEVSYAAAEGLGASTTSAATPAADEPSGGRAVPPAAFRRALLTAALLGVVLVSSAAFAYFAGPRGAGDLYFEPVRRELLLDDAAALGKIKDPRAVNPLIATVGHGNMGTRMAGVEALARLTCDDTD